MNGTKHEFEKLSSKIIGAAIEVHKNLGPGFLENIYHKSLKKELDILNIPYETETEEKIYYKDELVGEHRLDLIVNDEIVVELKSVKEAAEVHRAQLISYLKASGKRVGLLINFAKSRVEVKRMIWDY